MFELISVAGGVPFLALLDKVILEVENLHISLYMLEKSIISLSVCNDGIFIVKIKFYLNWIN